jgi:hypothetical protein
MAEDDTGLSRALFFFKMKKTVRSYLHCSATEEFSE